jgi:hypothetical protein
MIWLLLSVSGLAAEIALIVTLGRHVTSRYEAEESSGREWRTAEPPAVRTEPTAAQQSS